MATRYGWYALLLWFGVAQSSAQNGLTAIDSLNPRGNGQAGPNFGFYYAACWGYVAPDGHEYAILGTFQGTSIVDLDATPIREVAFIPGASNEWKEMKTWGHYLYAVSEASSQGLQIINLSQLPDTAWLVRSVTSVGGRNVSRSHTITVADGYLYLNGANSSGQRGGSIILSLADPENPTFVGEWQPAYFHDVYVRRDTLYAAALGNGVYIGSVANKASPDSIARITYAGSGTHNTWASVDGRFLFTTDEVGSTTKNMKVYDISALPGITPLTPFTPAPTIVIHNVHGRGNFAYISHYQAGVFVADIHDPSAITNAGAFVTYRGGGTNPLYAGCWDVFPYFPSGRIIASDTQRGLYVMRFTGLAPRSRSPLLAPGNGDSVAIGSPVTFRWRQAASVAEDPHYYQVHVWGPGVDTVLKSDDSTLTASGLPLQTGQTYSWHVWIRDEYTAVTSQDTFRFSYGSPTVYTPEPETPARFTLEQNHPNPFNPSTRISYAVEALGLVDLKVFNLLGQEVATLVNEVKPAGKYTVDFNAEGLGGGVYFYRLSTEGGFSETRKMILLR